MLNFPERLTFDDVLLEPGYSVIRRHQVQIATQLTKRWNLEVPILAAPMDTVTEAALAIALGKLGGLGVIHKNMPVAKQANQVVKVKKQIKARPAAAAISFGEEAKIRARALLKAGVDILVIDTAHGHSQGVIEMVKYLKSNRQYKKIDIIAGNVGTAQGVKDLIKAGADAVKVGIGPGSICTTRVVTGIGVPQLSAVLEGVRAARSANIPIIADGGINYSGDIVKALAAGAAAVMIGRLLAGCKESPGRLIRSQGRLFKAYRGMGSGEAMRLGSKDRYGQAGLTVSKLIPEGVSAQVPYVGTVSAVVEQLVGGLKSGMVYVGAVNLTELAKRARFVRITEASLKESHPHDLFAVQEEPNYKK